MFIYINKTKKYYRVKEFLFFFIVLKKFPILIIFKGIVQ